MQKVVKTDAEWKKLLTPEQYKIARRQDTEPAFCGGLLNNKELGIYFCVCCGLPLFASGAKFDSGTGWPSFFEPFAPENITEKPDPSIPGRPRIEILCTRCDAHLGHVFKDGPAPTGLRYCLNSAVLRFASYDDIRAGKAPGIGKLEKAVFAAGCFWHVEETFRTIPGVFATRVGYTGGHRPNPTYEDVCGDGTGHAEAVEVTYDASQVSYEQLLDVFWKNHDPTALNRQGPDEGTQYRSAIFYDSPDQQKTALASKDRLQKSGKYRKPIVTEVAAASTFWPAEEYHQQYLLKKGLKSCGIVSE